MSFPRYPECKDSGVKWLGEVPVHWDVSSFRHCLSHMFNGLAATQVDEAENTVPVTRIETISYGVIDESKLGFINSDDARADRALLPGDILFSNINSLNMVGKCAFYPGGRTIYAGMNLLVLRPATTKCSPLWLCWLVRSASFRCVVESVAKPAINQASVSQSSINSITVAIPTFPEQTQIAAFLDLETAKIDELVAEQRRLMALLKEKRQSVISHAVTQGLNPDAPMKPSGIEWLGEVPEHWDMVPLGMLTNLIQTGPFGSQLHSAEYVDDGTPVINPSNIQDGKLEPDWSCSITPENVERLSQHKLIAGDIVFGRRGEMGRCALVSVSEVGWICGTGSLNVRLSDRADPQFVSIYLRTEYVREWLKLQSVGSTMDNLNTGILGSIIVPVPPLEEQKSIASFLADRTSKFDRLTTEAQRAIDLLQERRTALISAAVTGQIDVRNT